MATRKQHCKDCVEKLGSDFNEVHAWLDGLACIDGKLNINHRRFRHHEEALDEIREMFGDEAVDAAKIHLIRDFGYIPTRDEVEKMCPEEPHLIEFPKRKKKRDARGNP